MWCGKHIANTLNMLFTLFRKNKIKLNDQNNQTLTSSCSSVVVVDVFSLSQVPQRARPGRQHFGIKEEGGASIQR